MWSVLQERVYRTKISDVDELKRRINSEWAAPNHAVIERAVGEWCQRLRACVRAGGGHFEHIYNIIESRLNVCHLSPL